ncbi:MAG TPA: hypothetical protein VGK36_16900 [Candidatus Angelobacter sp.]
MRSILILIALCAPTAIFGQQCSAPSFILVSEQSLNKVGCPVAPPINQPVSITDNYAISCSVTSGSANFPSTYFSDSTTVTGQGQCQLDPVTGKDKARCNPVMSMHATTATDASGVGAPGNNQFFNDAKDEFIDVTGKCNASGFHEDFHQCSGKPCDAPIGPPPPPPPPCSPPPSDQEFTNNNPGDSGDCEPLILDLTGEGFHLTDTSHGVVFDIRADGHPLRLPWTADSRNGFLVLDRNGNGLVDDGSELFGNATPQPQSAHPNGFGALAQYDWNGDGIIDERDPVYSLLRIWTDANHDGICQPEEMHTLPELGVVSISLDYSLSGRTDEYGNVFRYKAHVNRGLHGPSDVGKTAYDVFLVTR